MTDAEFFYGLPEAPEPPAEVQKAPEKTDCEKLRDILFHKARRHRSGDMADTEVRRGSFRVPYQQRLSFRKGRRPLLDLPLSEAGAGDYDSL